jgi:hypothetical protein
MRLLVAFATAIILATTAVVNADYNVVDEGLTPTGMVRNLLISLFHDIKCCFS